MDECAKDKEPFIETFGGQVRPSLALEHPDQGYVVGWRQFWAGGGGLLAEVDESGYGGGDPWEQQRKLSASLRAGVTVRAVSFSR